MGVISLVFRVFLWLKVVFYRFSFIVKLGKRFLGFFVCRVMICLRILDLKLLIIFFIIFIILYIILNFFRVERKLIIFFLLYVVFLYIIVLLFGWFWFFRGDLILWILLSSFLRFGSFFRRFIILEILLGIIMRFFMVFRRLLIV